MELLGLQETGDISTPAEALKGSLFKDEALKSGRTQHDHDFAQGALQGPLNGTAN